MSYKIEKIREVLKANRLVEFAYLFGSRVKAKATKRSDWDIAIYFKKDRIVSIMDNFSPRGRDRKGDR
jgi:predicted nucleotidyltransferase